jgi:hypothetical protein
MRKRTLALAALLALTTFGLSHVTALADAAANAGPVDSQPVPLPPAPTNTTPGTTVAPSTTPVAAVDPSTANIVSRLSTTLNPSLIPTDTMLQDDISLGRQMGSQGKDLIDVLNVGGKAFAFKPGGILRQTRRAVGTVYFITPGIEARWRGFLESKQLATEATRQADFDAVRNHVIAARRTLTFIVELDNLIKNASDGSTPESVDDAQKKVAGTRIVLSDDKDTNYDPITVPTGPTLISRRQFFEAIANQPDAVVTALSADDLPKATDNPSWSGLIKKRNGFNDLSAFYLVSYDAFNADGTARVNRDTNSITLHILGPDGQKYVAYKLIDLP